MLDDFDDDNENNANTIFRYFYLPIIRSLFIFGFSGKMDKRSETPR